MNPWNRRKVVWLYLGNDALVHAIIRGTWIKLRNTDHVKLKYVYVLSYFESSYIQKGRHRKTGKKQGMKVTLMLVLISFYMLLFLNDLIDWSFVEER